MDEIAGMAGFFAAHGVWSVSDGATLIPLLGYEQVDGERGMDRLVFDDIADGARKPARRRWRRGVTAGFARCSSPTPTFTSTRAGSTR